jgi:hypothetical protein
VHVQPRRYALLLARARASIGLNLLLFPTLSTRLGIGTPTPTSNVALRMAGLRDVALGLGAVNEIREGDRGPEWLGWGAVADGVDALVLLATPGLPKRARLGGLLAGAAAIVGMRLAWLLADERAAPRS